MHRQTRAYGALFIGPLLSCISLLLCAPTYSMDGVFDRDEEVRSYISVVEAGSRREFIEAARKIYMSGISDERLALALQNRLLNEFDKLGAPRLARGRRMNALVVEELYLDDSDAGYGMWLVHAACSTGAELFNTTFYAVANRHTGANFKELRSLAARSKRQLDWHRKKNELMATRQHHREGDDPQVSRLVNLLHADDLSYRDFVYDYIRVNKLREPRYFEIVGANVLASISAPAAQPPNILLAREIKLLGDSNDRGYAEILQRVVDSNADVKIKNQAQAALSKLR